MIPEQRTKFPSGLPEIKYQRGAQIMQMEHCRLLEGFKMPTNEVVSILNNVLGRDWGYGQAIH
jgi:hypothetical protein